MGFPMPWHCACVSEPEPARGRPRIDISKIGSPTNFQHTGHIGSSEMGAANTLSTVKTQMQSKGSPAVSSPAASSGPGGPASNALSLEDAQRLFGAKKAAAAAAAAKTENS